MLLFVKSFFRQIFIQFSFLLDLIFAFIFPTGDLQPPKAVGPKRSLTPATDDKMEAYPTLKPLKPGEKPADAEKAGPKLADTKKPAAAPAKPPAKKPEETKPAAAKPAGPPKPSASPRPSVAE